MGNSAIEWTNKVWNPVTGCTKVSQGCKHCYAEAIADRFWAKQYPPNSDGSLRRFTDVRCHPERLQEPLRWRKPAMIFVNSMSDLFHEDVPDEFITDIFNIMALAPWHTFQILTKRPERMRREVVRLSRSIAPLEAAARTLGYTFKFKGLDGQEHSTLPFPLRNVWLGVSVEDQKATDERIPLLLQTPAAVRWISAEPLLGPIDLRSPKLDWVVVGGESGPHSRHMHPDWARSLRDQCIAAEVPFFFKQWGEWDQKMDRVGKKAAGSLLDGKDWKEYPKAR